MDEDFIVPILMLSGWQAGSLLGQMIEQGRIFPEAVMVGLCLAFLFLISWRIGRRLRKLEDEKSKLLDFGSDSSKVILL